MSYSLVLFSFFCLKVQTDELSSETLSANLRMPLKIVGGNPLPIGLVIKRKALGPQGQVYNLAPTM